MNYRKISLGSLFIILSGILYEIDKALSYYKWASFIKAINANGGYSANPDEITMYDNKFIILFLIIGVAIYIEAFLSYYKKKE